MRLALALGGKMQAVEVLHSALRALERPGGRAWAILSRVGPGRYEAVLDEGVGHEELRLLAARSGDSRWWLCLDRAIPTGAGLGAPTWGAARSPVEPELVLGCWPAPGRAARWGVSRSQLDTAARMIATAMNSARAFESLLAQTSRDPLTGLLNRSGLLEALNRETARAGRAARPAAVLYLDLDEFKEINDRHGHAIGDQVLVAAAARLARVLRASDALGRIGGDEFLAVLPDTDLRAASRTGRRLAHELASAPMQTSVGSIRLSLTYGAASVEERLDGPRLIDRADRRMLHRKRRRQASGARLALQQPVGPAARVAAR